MQRILLIGSSGAGKSTLATKLGKKLNIPVTHLDRLFWKPGWEFEDTELFIHKMNEVVKGDQWIIDGNYTRWLHLRIPHADTIIFFDFPVWLTLWGVCKRWWVHRNKSRPDMADGCHEHINLEFLRYVITFRKKVPIIESAIKEFGQGKKVYRLRNFKEVREFLKSI